MSEPVVAIGQDGSCVICPSAPVTLEKVFELSHLFFEGVKSEHLESNLPSWLMRRDMEWFLAAYVLTLGVGEYVDTDFQRITRIK